MFGIYAIWAKSGLTLLEGSKAARFVEIPLRPPLAAYLHWIMQI